MCYLRGMLHTSTSFTWERDRISPSAPTYSKGNIGINQESPGAVTLERSIVRNSSNSVYMEKQIHSWVSAIKRGYKKPMDWAESLTTEEKNIFQWYTERLSSATYQAPNWKISPEKSILFQKFRSDPWYHLKNLVEIVIREFIEADLRDQGYNDAKVWRTSDTDDVCAWVDLIVEIPKTATQPVEYFGIDVAISTNERYLEQKQTKKVSECSEFNAYKWKRGMIMDREVYSFSPKVISYFLSSYMRSIMKWVTPAPLEILSLFDSAIKVSTSQVRENTSQAVSKILH